MLGPRTSERPNPISKAPLTSAGTKRKARPSLKIAATASTAATRDTGIITRRTSRRFHARSEEHTSELQSLAYLVCRLLLEKKKYHHVIKTPYTYCYEHQ